MTRRRFVLLVTALVTAVWSAWAIVRRRAPQMSQETRSPLVGHLEQQFPYLRFEDGAVAAFAVAYEAHHGPADLSRPQVLDDLCTQFLMSTDFFQNGAAEARPIRFVTLYDPYVSPCYNPLAQSNLDMKEKD